MREDLEGEPKSILSQVDDLPKLATMIIKLEEHLKELAEKYREIKSFIVMGQGPAFPIACEGALKIKESSYVVTEAVRPLEFRHGWISIVDNASIAYFIIALRGVHYSYVTKLARQVIEKGGNVILITNEYKPEIRAETIVKIPSDLHELLTAHLMIIPIQIFAYYYSTGKGRNPDKPRHLVKSVISF